MSGQLLSVGGRLVPVSSLGRVLYPLTGYTKAELIEYYVAVSSAILPHLRARPLTLRRYPQGVAGPDFFQSRCPPHPPWLRTATMFFPRTGKTFEAPVIDDVAGLVWAGNLATIELHPFLGRLPHLQRPTDVVFDLDPGPPAGLAEACAAALAVRNLLSQSGLRAWANVSGVKGLHLRVPLNTPVTFTETKSFARGVARLLTRDMPHQVIDQMSRSLRPGKVFLDWSQNDPGKSTVVPYSLRGLRVPSVAAPVTWEEVAAQAAGAGDYLAFSPADTLARLHSHGELLAGLLEAQQQLPPPQGAACSTRA